MRGIGIEKASKEIEKTLSEIIKLKHKWNKIYNEEYQRARKPERIKKIEIELDVIENEIKDKTRKVNELSEKIRRCAELLERFEVSRSFDLWKPEEEYTIEECKRLLKE